MPDTGEICSSEYYAKKDDVSLYMFRKRVIPNPLSNPTPVLFFVHGSSISSRSTFDLTVPNRGEYSMMEVFARLGFDCWTMDHENYGRSSRTAGNSDIASGVDDLRAAAEVIERETGRRKIHYFGESSGGLRAGAYAMVQPDRVDRLVLGAFTYKGEGSSTLADRSKQVSHYRSHARRKRDRDMILSIFTRDKPGTSDPAVAEALAESELKFGDEVPTGTYLDMTANLPVVLPEKVRSPVLLVRGEFDGIATMTDLAAFFVALPNGHRQFIVLPGAAHSVIFGYNRRHLWEVVHRFLTAPIGQNP